MSEVKTAPVKAVFVETEAEFFDERMRTKIPGSIFITETEEGYGPGGRWLYACPCGCGASGGLRVGTREKPNVQPSWDWNGSKEAPDLNPSVHHIGHWHGWLRNGMWVSV